ncbi:Alpha/Beta hydrolase protein [Truncatella angustata]|uniref:Alpha/Beta hydrolase protein n=1 Tax=Truncatella angustata TaxID=152316 RepID=A0A9P9A3Q4_9PEZI|nr:Alpha/Beta hydrolase protein [Truncatella angustata]KAH6659149.1 Alpha/Beta hydrolase protein [Truncatella angustata]
MTGNPEWMKLAEVDPDLDKFLKAAAASPKPGPPPGLETDYAAQRAFLHKTKKAVNARAFPTSTGLIIEDSLISARDGYQIPIRTYKPVNPPKTGSPLIVIFHGGGFTLGDLETEEGSCRNFCQQLGCTVVNVDYRLAPENPFPTPLYDAYDSVKWAASNASKLGANPDAGFLLGAVSAGANLALVSATLARDEKLSPPLTGLWLSIPIVMSMKFPPAHLVAELQSFEQCKEAPVLNAKTWKVLIDAYKPDERSRLFNLYSETDPVSRAGLPPVYFQVCGWDPLRDEALCFERELREEHGTKTKLKLYPGMPHGFWSFFPQLGKTPQWVAETVSGIQWLLDVGKQES